MACERDAYRAGVVRGSQWVENKAVSAYFDSLSPVAVIKAMSNGEVAVLENNKKVGTIDTKTGTLKTSTVKKSTKTGV